MKNRITYISLIAVISLGTFSSCKKGCTDPKAINFDEKAKKENNSCEYAQIKNSAISFKMEHKYNGTDVALSDFDTIKYNNDKGTSHSITKMRYLISDFVLYKADGSSIVVNKYNFVDFTDASSFIYAFPSDIEVPYGDYTGIGFTWGFDEEDNVTGAYTDLNAASWSWPAMIGGGYHFMQFEGRFIDANTDTLSFQYHNGTAKNPTSGNFEANHFDVKLNQNFSINKENTSVAIVMNIDEWFKNPNQWDLDTLHSMLMPNYNAQIMMNENGRTVFTFGGVE